MSFAAIILFHFITHLAAHSEAPSAKLAACFQWTFQVGSSVSATLTCTEAAHSNWVSQGNLTGFMNKCCLLPGELLTLPTGSLSVLSITVAPLLLPTVHLNSHISHIVYLLWHINPTHFFHQYSTVEILILSNAVNRKGLPPTHLQQRETDSRFSYFGIFVTVKWLRSSNIFL